jgi:hypothetical protein
MSYVVVVAVGEVGMCFEIGEVGKSYAAVVVVEVDMCFGIGIGEVGMNYAAVAAVGEVDMCFETGKTGSYFAAAAAAAEVLGRNYAAEKPVGAALRPGTTHQPQIQSPRPRSR